MRFLTNIYDPTRSDAVEKTVPLPGQTRQAAFDQQRKWLSGKTIGNPKATDAYTSWQLHKMGMVGVYMDEI